MPVNQIVARFRDGTSLKGETSDFFPTQPRFHITTPEGEMELVNTDDLKAIFFVRDLDGDRERTDDYNEEVNGVGRKIRVTFSDGEVITGFAAGYSKARIGFYLFPANTRINNKRIFIINEFCREARFI